MYAEAVKIFWPKINLPLEELLRKKGKCRLVKLFCLRQIVIVHENCKDRKKP